MVMLMLIGGAPGSTAGGMKMTTIAVLLLSAAAVFRRKEDAQCFGRRIPNETVRYAAVVMLMYVVLCTLGGLFLCYAEGLPVLTDTGGNTHAGNSCKAGAHCFNVLWACRWTDTGVCGAVWNAVEYDKVPTGEDNCGII